MEENSLGEYWTLVKDANWLTEYRLRKLKHVNTGFTIASDNRRVSLKHLKRNLDDFAFKCKLGTAGAFVYEKPRTFNVDSRTGYKEYEADFWFDNVQERDKFLEEFSKL